MNLFKQNSVVNCRYISNVAMVLIAPLIAAAALAAPAKGAIITQYDPNYTISPGFVELPVDITNNDNGAVYNSFDLLLFNTLATGLYGLSHNQANYASVEALTADWQLSILPNPVGEVDNKWFVDTSSYAPAEIYHSGLGYDQWYATQQQPNQDTMALRLSIPLSQLDGNGNGWSSTDTSDYTVSMNVYESPNMGIGRVNALESYSAPGHEYNINIVPEPNTIALLLLGAGLLYATRKKEELLNDNP